MAEPDTQPHHEPDPRPILFVTNFAPDYRIGCFNELNKNEHVHFALTGGSFRHGGPQPEAETELVSSKEVYTLAASGQFRAVIAGISGMTALPAAWLGAKKAGIPFILWATLWRHPRTIKHLFSYLPLRKIYRDADAVVTYGPHVSAYVKTKRTRGNVFEAPQSVDNNFWSAPAKPTRIAKNFQLMFSGRLNREKGLQVLLQAWRASGLSAPTAALVLVGDGPFRARAVATGAAPPHEDGGLSRARAAVLVPPLPEGRGKRGVSNAPPSKHDLSKEVVVENELSFIPIMEAGFVLTEASSSKSPASAASSATAAIDSAISREDPSTNHSGNGIVAPGTLPPSEVRSFYAGSDVLVLPSLRTRDFCEPWGLVINEAFNQGVPVIVSDAVGAAAGGLVQHEENGLVVPSNDVPALAAAIHRLHVEEELRQRLSENARKSVMSYNNVSWATGMTSALTAVGVSNSPNGR